MVKGKQMSGIFQRIGEAVASQGKITLVAAFSSTDGEILKGAGFKKVGSTDFDGELIDIYEVKIQQIVNTQPHQIKVPIKDEKPSWPYNNNHPMYSTSSSTPSTVSYRGNVTSLSGDEAVEYLEKMKREFTFR